MAKKILDSLFITEIYNFAIVRNSNHNLLVYGTKTQSEIYFLKDNATCHVFLRLQCGNKLTPRKYQKLLIRSFKCRNINWTSLDY